MIADCLIGGRYGWFLVCDLLMAERKRGVDHRETGPPGKYLKSLLSAPAARQRAQLEEA